MFAVVLFLSLSSTIAGAGVWMCANSTISDDAPKTIASLVVKSIDEHYLYASAPAWKAAREKIVNATPSSGHAMYVFVAQQLASMHDSELHLVSPSELAAIQSESEGKKIGAGLMDFTIDSVPTSGEARIVTPLSGSPAAISGLRPHDVIIAIDGKPTRDLDHEQFLDLLRSTSGADLLVRRGTRKFRVHLSPSDAPVEAFTTKSIRAGSRNIAYLRISQFTSEVGARTRAAVQDFEKERAIGYIVDLRNNPGGFLGAATQVASLFVTGSLGDKVRRDGTTEPIPSTGTPLTDAPVVVLVNEGTASAAEFVAGALHNRKQTVLLGAQTYGRGQAQILEPLSDGYGVVIPSVLIKTPDGRTFKGTGLEPDIRVSSSVHTEATDRQLQRAIAWILQAR